MGRGKEGKTFGLVQKICSDNPINRTKFQMIVLLTHHRFTTEKSTHDFHEDTVSCKLCELTEIVFYLFEETSRFISNWILLAGSHRHR